MGQVRTRRAERLLDVDGVAARLGTSVRHIRRLVAEQRIPVVRVGRLVRFDPVDVDGWLDEHRTAARPS